MSESAPMSGAETAANSRVLRSLLIVAAVGGVLLMGTLALWAHYGTAVFYEMVLAGIALCL
jgi:hypothetical protein